MESKILKIGFQANVVVCGHYIVRQSHFGSGSSGFACLHQEPPGFLETNEKMQEGDAAAEGGTTEDLDSTVFAEELELCATLEQYLAKNRSSGK